MFHILSVEDDPAISRLLDMNLSVAGYAVRTAADGARALQLLERERFDLALLDIMLPEIDGFALLPFMKKHHIPVIYLSAKADVADRVQGLRLGAEDYLVKPFDMLELLVRMEKILSRTQPRPVLSGAGVTVFENEHRVEVAGRTVELKPMEYALMLMFLKHQGIVMSREQLLREVWGDEYFGETRTVDSHVAALRKKLSWGNRIVTVHRVGYRLEDPL